MNLTVRVPSYSQICRKAATPDVVPYQIPMSGLVVIAIDSTGLKVYGEGEWKVRKHGHSKRRTCRKLHIGVDAETGFIHCHTLTFNNEDDRSLLQTCLTRLARKFRMDAWTVLTITKIAGTI